MTIFGRTSMVAAMAGVLLLVGAPVHAQEPMSEEEVTGFFDSMDQELTQMVEAGDFDGMIDWMNEIIADEAKFFASVETYAGDERKSFNVFSLDKQDMTRIGQIAVGVMAAIQGEQQALEDYTLDIEVREVIPAGAEAATVTTHITESATLAMPQGQAAAASGADASDDAETTGSTGETEGESRSLSFEATADCEHFIRRAQAEDALRLGLTACEATTNF